MCACLRIKKRYNGIILLIGHLYKFNLINNHILEYVLKKLINPMDKDYPDEYNLDFLYNVYPVVHDNMNYKIWKKLKQFKPILNSIIKDERISLRIRYKYMNILEKYGNKM